MISVPHLWSVPGWVDFCLPCPRLPVIGRVHAEVPLPTQPPGSSGFYPPLGACPPSVLSPATLPPSEHAPVGLLSRTWPLLSSPQQICGLLRAKTRVHFRTPHHTRPNVGGQE